MSENSGGAAIGVGAIAYPVATLAAAYWVYLNYGLMWAVITLPLASIGGVVAVVIGGILLVLLNLLLLVAAAAPFLPFVGLYALIK